MEEDDIERDWTTAFFNRLKSCFKSEITVVECQPDASIEIARKFKTSAIRSRDHVEDIQEIMAKELALALLERVGDIPLTVCPTPLLSCSSGGTTAEFKIAIGYRTATARL